MKIIADLHTHTVASGHAYSTLKENIEQAALLGLEYLGVSDHTPGMPGTTQPGYFGNLRVLRPNIGNVRLLRGAEANIVDANGAIDLPREAADLDYVIASLHDSTIKNMGMQQNTRAVTAAMENPRVKIIGHPDDSRFPLDYEQVVLAAKRTGTALELNNSSLSPHSTRRDGPRNAAQMLKLCKALKTPIIVGSDSHIWYDIGNFEYALALLEECAFPAELVINGDLARFESFIHTMKPGLPRRPQIAG